MGESITNNRLLRGVIFQNLYVIQHGMYSYRNTHNSYALHECFQRAFGMIIASAKAIGQKDVADFCQGILDLCEMSRWADINACLEIFKLINSGVDWMLLYVDPELDRYGNGQKKHLAANAPLQILSDLRRTIERNMSANHTNEPAMLPSTLSMA